MTDVFKLIEDHGLTLHGDIEHFAELVRAEAEKQEQKTPLKVLNLTVFTENRLRNGRVYDVETLQTMTNRDILAIPDMGKKALKEVLEALNAYAIDMSQERVDETAKDRHEPYNPMERNADYERGFIDGRADQMKSSVDRAVNRMAQREWVGLATGEAREFYESDLSREELIHKIDEFLQEKNT